MFVWDIGGRKGTVYELHGHRQKVTFVRFLPSSKQLMTAGEDGNLVLWDMATTRIEVQPICVIFNNIFMCLYIQLILRYFNQFTIPFTDMRLDRIRYLSAVQSAIFLELSSDV